MTRYCVITLVVGGMMSVLSFRGQRLLIEREMRSAPKSLWGSLSRSCLGTLHTCPPSSFLLRQEVSVVFVFPPYLVPSRGRLVVQGKRLAEAECFFGPLLRHPRYRRCFPTSIVA